MRVPSMWFSIFVVLATLFVACSDSTNPTGDSGSNNDGGSNDAVADATVVPDAALDGETVSDATTDSAGDAGWDATVGDSDKNDATSDTGVDAVAETGADAPAAEGSIDSGIDAPADSPVDSPTDAPNDGLGDASDGGQSLFGIAVSAGYNKTCALTTDGGVWCWGYNADGSLGIDRKTQFNHPVSVSGLPSGVVAVTAGGPRTCVLTSAGAVWCWGATPAMGCDNDAFCAGAPISPTMVPSLSSGVVSIFAGSTHVCALTSGGAVRCWGDNDSGQLGNNSSTRSDVPVAVSGLSSGVAAISAGGNSTCAVTTSGAAWCWGDNTYGQLGNNSTLSWPVPVAVTGLSSGVGTISVSSGSACAVKTGGTVSCWGRNNVGQLGNNSTSNSSVPVDVSGLSGVARVWANGSCALTTNGAVMCWGDNTYGQLGNNSTNPSLVPVAVSGLSSGVVDVLARGSANCALKNDGAIWCWGRKGFLGRDETGDSLVPVANPNLPTGIVSVSSGLGSHLCVLHASGNVSCWGYNQNGQVGIAPIIISRVPLHVTGLPVNITSIATEGAYACGLTSGGQVWCWGEGATPEVPAAVAGLPNDVVAISTRDRKCARSSGGAVWCWGDSYLGNNTNTPSAVPVLVSGMSSGIAAISVGGASSCAVTTAGAVSCWGSNLYNELGNNSNTNTPSLVPVPVSGLSSGVASVAAGSEHNCALTMGGAVFCWGKQGAQLGHNGVGNVPGLAVGMTSGVTAIAAGCDGTLALTVDGGVMAWGSYNGTTVGSSAVPVPIPSLSSGVVGFSVGGFYTVHHHGCAVTSSGKIWCWGRNNFGQLGTALTDDSNMPGEVFGF